MKVFRDAGKTSTGNVVKPWMYAEKQRTLHWQFSSFVKQNENNVCWINLKISYHAEREQWQDCNLALTSDTVSRLFAVRNPACEAIWIMPCAICSEGRFHYYCH